MMAKKFINGNTYAFLEGEQTCTATVTVIEEEGNQSTSRYSYTTLEHTPKNCVILSQAHLLNHVHGSSIHKNEKIEIKYVHQNRGIIFNVAYLYSATQPL